MFGSEVRSGQGERAWLHHPGKGDGSLGRLPVLGSWFPPHSNVCATVRVTKEVREAYPVLAAASEGNGDTSDVRNSGSEDSTEASGSCWSKLRDNATANRRDQARPGIAGNGKHLLWAAAGSSLTW